MCGEGRHVLDAARVRRSRLRSNLLEPRGGTGVADTVRALGAVQAQVPRSAALCLRARTTGLDATAVEAARVVERSVVRSWFLRGTLHLVPAADAGWLSELYDPVHRAGAAHRYRALGLTDDDLAAGVRAIRAALTRDGPLVAREIAEHLAAAGVDPSGQRLYHLICRAAMRGVLCHGPQVDGETAYVPLPDWLDATDRAGRSAGPSGDGAVAELACRYVTAHGPVDLADFVAWSGLPVRLARAGWARVAGAMVQVDSPRGPAVMTPGAAVAAREPAADAPAVRLLPSFDAYMLGYRDRVLSVPAGHQRSVWTGGGWIRPTLTVDGWAVATWAVDRRGSTTRVVVDPFEALDDHARAGLAAEVADLGRFLGVAATTAVH